MKSLWLKVIQFLAKIFGVQVVPPEVSNNDVLVASWFEIYQGKATWLPYDFITSDGKKRNRKRFTLNMAKMVCSEMAGLVLAETPDLEVSEGVKDVIKKENFWKNFRKHLEFQGANGGQAIKIFKEDENIGLDFVLAQNFIPLSWDNSIVTEASFIDRRTKGNRSFVRVETHKKAKQDIDGRVAEGYLVTSRAFDELTNLEVSLENLWPGVEAEVFIEIDEPLFVYMSNPEANNFNPQSPLGISIFANAIDTLQSLDYAFDAFRTEILLGRQRIALTSSVMRGYTDPDTQKKKYGFDPTDEAYIRLEGDDTDKFKPTDLSGQLRIQPLIQAIQLGLNILAVQCGFSSGYFSFDGVSVKTATEVVSENSKTYKTIQAIKDVADEGLKHLFRIIDKINAIEPKEPNIIWDDGVVEDRNSKAVYYEGLVAAKLEDQVSAIMKIHGLDKDAATEKAALINKAQSEKVNSLFSNEGGL
jgi:A118 family predicted phage portal protein